ncbi:hypothetical protein BBK36DRAFT_1198799 [Trichoderma citrinoviride]|uniref:Uncharacterized protein n=1 Tax=Trichoderma citrinoviride TaxID=58853 RepID=A0A2T4BC39_9HYPO|nr:hypothetical protein BBK36DRAFT_1198799 [Trichoderma citrinoviride]PTB66894.1 hypothetical protein BBK36DRAFT_1198799 [Trichoderma citrinoviride]
MSSTSVTSRPQVSPRPLPQDLISIATLRYLGFDEEAAWFIWCDRVCPLVRDEHSLDFNDDVNQAFICHIIEHVHEHGGNTCEDNDQTWHESMAACGIDVWTRRAIMDPIFKRIRLTQSCLYWVRDTIHHRFQALLDVRAAGAPSTPGYDRAVQSALEGSNVPQDSQPAETAMSKAVLDAAESSSGSSVALYKGIDRASLGHLFKNKLHSSRISSLATRGPTDVSPTSSAYYFYVDRDIAEQQACYIRRRSFLTPVVLVQVTIQESMLETGYLGPRRQEMYWPSEEWKELALRWKRGETPSPPILAEYMKAQLVIITAAAKANLFFCKNLKRPDRITEDMVMKNKQGKDAVQYCFRRYDGDHFLAKHAELKMLPFMEEEVEAWCIEARGEDGFPYVPCGVVRRRFGRGQIQLSSSLRWKNYYV